MVEDWGWHHWWLKGQKRGAHATLGGMTTPFDTSLGNGGSFIPPISGEK